MEVWGQMYKDYPMYELSSKGNVRKCGTNKNLKIIKSLINVIQHVYHQGAQLKKSAGQRELDPQPPPQPPEL